MEYKISYWKPFLVIFFLIIFIVLLIIPELSNSISRFDYDGFKDNIIIPFSFLLLSIRAIFFSYEISIYENNLTIQRWSQKVDLRKEDIVGYSDVLGAIFLKAKQKNYWISSIGINDFSQLRAHIEGNYERISLLKSVKNNIFHSLITGIIFLFMFSSFFYGTNRNGTLKYKLPLNNIKVHELEVSLREDYKLKQKYNTNNAIPLWEYPKVAFHLNAYLKDEINNIPEDGMLLPKEEVLKVQIREKDFIKLSNRQKKGFNPYKGRKKDIVTIYKIEHEGNVLYEKCCLK